MAALVGGLPYAPQFLPDETTDTPNKASIALLLAVAHKLRVGNAARCHALMCLADRALPELEFCLARGVQVPALAPLALAALLISSKLHDTLAPLISEIVAAAVSLGAKTTVDGERGGSIAQAEGWLVSRPHLIALGEPCSDDVCWMVEALSEAGVCPHGTKYISLSLCLSLFELLYERKACRMWLSKGGRGLAAALVWASTSLSVPPQLRASYAPAMVWLASATGDDATDVAHTAHVILRLVLDKPDSDE